MNLSKFDHKCLYLSDDDQRRVYHRRTNDSKTCIPWGQRKLLLVETLFLTLYVDRIENPKIIYAGAAPGKHIEQLSKMFPTCEFYLWDPNDFHIKANKNIHIYQEYFTDEIAQKWSNRNDVFFISDIRTADYEKINNSEENEKQIMEDMFRQQKWYEIINPFKALLKFRLPYSDHNMPMKIKYLSGLLLKQSWAPQTSTETRLIPDGKYTEWDSIKYEEQMFYFNSIIRETFRYDNPFKTIFPLNDELINDYDSMSEVFILSEYLRHNKEEANAENVSELSQKLTDSINFGKKFKDSLSILRSNTRLIKDRNSNKKQKKLTVKRKNDF